MLKDGLDDRTIEALVNELAALDSNNFLRTRGVGEREGRVFSGIENNICIVIWRKGFGS
jgi:O-phospho-L-seryl-tRNASec:L-selenocysteinyl-tRNA synthase